MAIVRRTVVVVSIASLIFVMLAAGVSAANPGADLSLTKTVDIPDPEIGEQVTFTLTVTNSGPDDASHVEVTDLLPGGLVYVSNSSGLYDSATGVWDASPLLAGDHRDLQIVATVTSATPVDNYAEVTAVTAPGLDLDSTPGNGSTSEDDDATALVSPRTPPGTIIVNSTADPGDGVADATQTTLREAIAQAEAGPEDTIQFAIGPGATQTITLDGASGPLEVIDNPIVIDGTTEGPGASGRVAIDGSNLASGNGLTLMAGNSTIRGLAVIAFPNHGIVIGGDGSNVIADNYLGLGLDGLTDAGNGLDGILIADTVVNPGGVNNTIGGTDASDRNVISGNGEYGINIEGGGRNVVRGNYVGLNAAGDEGRPNAQGGVLISSNNNDIGGLESTDDCSPCNVISGNGIAGVSLAGNDNVIHGNFIGTDASGEGEVPNQGDGIVVGDPGLTTTGTIIGNESPGVARNVINGNTGHGILVVGTGTTTTRIRGNLIGVTALSFPAGNGGDGVHVTDADNTTIESNQIRQSGMDGVAVEGRGARVFMRGSNVIFANGDLGIDLGADGVTVNDPDTANDGDTGPDGLQNFPDIASAVATNMPAQPGNTITIDFSLQTNANRTGIVVDFYESTSCNPGGPASPPFGEGFTVIGSVTVGTDADGSYPASGTDTVVFDRFVPPGFVLTATATGPDGTSEFSRCVTVEEAAAQSADLSLIKTASDPSPTVGDTVSFTVTLSNAGPDTATNVTVTDLLPAGLSFVSATPYQGTYTAATGIWSIGTLTSSNLALLDIRAKVTAAGPLTNYAQVSASDQADPDSTPGNDSQTEDDNAEITLQAAAQSADLSLIKTASDPSPTVGDTVSFTVTLSNAGPDTATNVTVTDLLPAGLTFVSATPSQGSYAAATGLWTVGSLAAAATPASLVIRATVTTTVTLYNYAQVSASDQADPDSTPGNNSQTEDDDAEATVQASGTSADLSLAKTVSDATPDIGVDFTFTLTVVNAVGGAGATGVVVRDLLPARLRFVSATPSQGTYNATTGVWTVGTVNSGANATLMLTVKHVGGSLAPVTNAAEITAADQPDPDSPHGNNSTTEDDDDAVAVTPTTPVCAGRNATIIGTIDDDTLTGTQGADIAVLFAGNDAFDGRKGNDVVCGGDGNDTAQGDQGTDLIFGEGGTDVLDGGQDADTVDGGAGDNDRVEGGNDSDTIGGGAGTGDFCGGNGGTDAFIGGSQVASGCETIAQIP